MPTIVLIAITVPLVAAFIGWVTNWAAVKMIFYPERFVGLGPVGWQGVLPRNAAKFASGVADTLTNTLLSTRDLAERLDPDEVLKLFEETLNQQILFMVREGAEKIRPGAWAKLPDHLRMTIVAEVRRQAVVVGKDLFAKVKDMSEELLDLRTLVVSMLSGKNTRRLVRLFQQIGAKELRFIEYYGGVFGFAIGLVQAAVWSVAQLWWLAPIVGTVVGLVTNYLAIQMIFRPHEEHRYLGFVRYQGLFPKRQAEIAADYGRLAAEEILTPQNLIRLVTERAAGLRIARLITDAVSSHIDQQWGRLQKMVPLPISDAQADEVKRVVVDHLARALPEAQPRLEAYLERKLDIASTLETKLGQLSKPQFERILRGLFEQDEIILVVIGGVLGGLVGVLQSVLTLAAG